MEFKLIAVFNGGWVSNSNYYGIHYSMTVWKV